MFTATDERPFEALGLALPGNGTILAVSKDASNSTAVPPRRLSNS